MRIVLAEAEEVTLVTSSGEQLIFADTQSGDMIDAMVGLATRCAIARNTPAAFMHNGILCAAYPWDKSESAVGERHNQEIARRSSSMASDVDVLTKRLADEFGSVDVPTLMAFKVQITKMIETRFEAPHDPFATE